MIVIRTSMISNTEKSMDIPVTEEKLQQWDDFLREERPLIQNFFPELNAEQREFILTGITPEEWDIIFEGESTHDFDDDFDDEPAF